MWTFDGNRIYVTDEDVSSNQIIARLQPLAGTTILHAFGYESEIYKFTCKVVGNTILDALKTLRTTGTAYTMSGTDGFSKSLYLHNLSYKRDNTIWQSIDPAQDCSTPVYTVTMELYE